jgi:hypothetical protein
LEPCSHKTFSSSVLFSIHRTLSLSKLTSSATAQTPIIRSVRITSLWSCLCLPKTVCTIQRRARSMQSSLQPAVNNWKISVVNLFNLTRNMMLSC